MTNRLRELRAKHNETQKELAKVLGLNSAQLYCKREVGYYPVTLEEAFKLSRHWGMSIEEIFFDDEVASKENTA